MFSLLGYFSLFVSTRTVRLSFALTKILFFTILRKESTNFLLKKVKFLDLYTNYYLP